MTDAPAAPQSDLAAAGILFVADGKVLLVQRAAGSDHVGEWCFPGGCLELGETPRDAALRESAEEVGVQANPETLTEHARRISEGVDYTTFLCRLPESFRPVLQEDECSAGAWFAPDGLPPNLHPGTKVALAKLSMNELDIAEAIRDGELTSPQRYMNVWLFDIRITGTGLSYRAANETTGQVEEFTWRRPEDYLNERFLQRANGLQVIWQHPDKSMLDSQEFATRTIGAILLPYIKADEVWGIAKVYDDGAADVMRTKQMSTSPAVMLRKVGFKTQLDDGTALLVEGEPALLDHVAICEQGVWDKLQAPTGVNSAGEVTVAEDTDKETKEMEAKAAEEKAEAKDMEAKEDSKKADAAEDETKADADGANIDKFLTKLDAKLDGLCARMDAMEGEKKADADKDETKADADEDETKKEEAKADYFKKADADEDVEKAKADAALARTENRELRRRLERLEMSQPAILGDKDYADLAAAQARADSVYNAFSTQAPPPLRGETPLAYRKRLISGIQKHSNAWKDVDMVSLADAAFSVAEGQVLADAAQAAERPMDLQPGMLREIIRPDTTGRRISTFVGRDTFIADMKRPTPRARLVTNRRDHH